MPSLDDLLTEIVTAEGGYVDDPADHGGPTKYGVTMNTLAAYLEHPVTKFDIQSLTIPQAKNVFKKMFYFDYHFDKLPAIIQPVVTDAGIMSGPARAIKFLQESINKISAHGNVGIDGILGPQTLNLVNILCTGNFGTHLVNEIVECRIAFYNQLVVDEPSQEKFLNGWTKRAEKFNI